MKCVCFDLGGVLVRIFHTWEDAMVAAGVSGSRKGPLTDFDGLGRLHEENIREPEYFSALADYLGGVTVSEAERVHAAILRGTYDQTTELIQELKSAGFAVAGLSNTNWSHVHEMQNSGRFANVTSLDLLVTSCEAKLNKPDPAIYRHFEAVSGYSGQEIVFFDDSLTNVHAAQQCGWRAYLVDPTQQTAPQIRLALGL